MKKRTIILIIVFASTSLVGLIFTQLFWIKHAVEKAEQQYDHRVTQALENTLQELVRIGKIRDLDKSENTPLLTATEPILETIDTLILDSLLKIYFKNYLLDDKFEYAIVKSLNDSTCFCKRGVLSNQISIKSHKAGLSCLWTTQSYHLEVYFPDKRKFVLQELAVWLGMSILFLLIVVISFSFTILTLLRHKKLSEMKNDFINNMTHEFKTPISSISLASEVLLKTNIQTPELKPVADRIQRYSKIIFDENNRLKTQVDRVLQMALLEKGDIELKLVETDIHLLIKDSVKNLCFEHCDKDVTINYKLEASNPNAVIDRLHIRNVFNNLLDNAYKYSHSEVQIDIMTYNHHQGIIISFQDNGIGISSEAQKYIFDKFYRFPTGNVHNVKGFGIGLYYVKKTIEAHAGFVGIKSEIGKGSCFELFLPHLPKLG